ncbi:heme ABC transporter ATP-binding protein [Sinirhodobacter populi]|uniref:Heme ABC transporter ATP-binding protein n=1 Tax=Paenirhodobacter populi TaxID=2306993 RepID=A0A443K5P1_9RHOB|nr:heme ABC transporter ATP-binding protein [Sinirhodobacter populi]RWR28091.1 heme ABC transporter ATP-binding protein [Sinirhodobacter populi]
MIEARDIGAVLGGTEILHGVDFIARPGEMTVIVGPNGSGKTTLLRRLTGDLDGPGAVTLDAAPVAAMPPRLLALRRAVLQQAVQVGFPFTLREVVRMGLEAGHSAHAPTVVDAAIAEVGLSAKADHFLHDLSGGEQARGHLARARAQIWQPVTQGRACWLFVDEPVAALDIGHQILVMEVLRRFADAGGGVVAVMHDLNLTAMHADRVVLMSEGRVLAEGPPEAVLTDDRLSAAYRSRIRINTAPVQGPWLLPQMAGRG